MTREKRSALDLCMTSRKPYLLDPIRLIFTFIRLNNTAKMNDNLSKQLTTLQESLKKEQDATKTLRQVELNLADL